MSESILIASLFASIVAAFCIVRSSRWHLGLTSDTVMGDGPQKIHHGATPRIGG
jgi:hypothetical protein